MTARTVQERDARLRGLTDQVAYFDPSNPIHMAHFAALEQVFGELGAAMLVSQDAAQAAEILRSTGVDGGLVLTDPGQIASHPGWRALNRVVRHGEKSRYVIFAWDAETKAGGRLVPLFTRDQTVPAYAQD